MGNRPNLKPMKWAAIKLLMYIRVNQQAQIQHKYIKNLLSY